MQQAEIDRFYFHLSKVRGFVGGANQQTVKSYLVRTIDISEELRTGR
jgi:hypothetical protein